MPPKKKLKEAELPQQVQVQPESQQQQQQQVFRIPKKPFYRSLLLDSEKQEKHIQIKLWKINSFKNKSYFGRLGKTIFRLSNKQRVFKNLRRFHNSLNSSYTPDINKLISKSWRLEKLCFSDTHHLQQAWMKKFIKSKLNHHLKDFFLSMNPSQKDIEKSIDEWEYLVDCNIWFHDSYHSLVLALNTKKIRSLRRFIKGSNKNQVIESVEMISPKILSKEMKIYHDFSKKDDIFYLSSMDPSQLPNLKTLNVSSAVSNSMDQFGFIKNYPQITTLVISIFAVVAASFEFLSSLPNLKQLTLHSRDRGKKISRTLPLIHSLEKLTISCDPAEFSPENLQEFFISNKNLKSLEVDLPLQDDYLIFHENLILSLETLKLKITNTKTTTIMRKLAAFFGRNQHLKSLEIYLYSDCPLEHSEILQKGITSITCLENLIWHGTLPGQLQDIQLKGFKNMFIQNPGIQKLELDFGHGVLMPRSSSSFIDGLLSLKNLKYFALRIAFIKISPATLGKFLQFLRFLVFEKVATVKLDLQGISEEITEEINILLPKKYRLFCDKNPDFSLKSGLEW